MVSISIGASSKLDKAGGTLTGPLVLSRDPLGDLEAATRRWVLTQIGAGGGGGVQIGGDIGGTSTVPAVIATHLGAPLPLAQGGTGQGAAQSALTALAGTQGAGKYLRSDGTNTALATIQAADVPVLNQSTTGTSSNITGIALIANGGTGQSTQAAALTALTGAQSAGRYLRSDGTNATLAAIQANDVPVLNQSTTGTAAGLSATLTVGSGGTGQASAAAAFNALSPNTTLGDLTYANGAGTNTRLPGSASAAKAFLTQTGNGSVSAAPAWGTIAAGDVPTLNQNTTGTASNITGIAAIANGGTGQSTQQSAINALTGTQSAGKYLRSDGTNAALANIQAADVPVLNQNTTGTAANVTGTVALANGGTGQVTAQAALNALAGAQTAGRYLRGDGTNVSLAAVQAADIPTLNQSTTGTAANVTGTVAVANGGTGATTAAGALSTLGAVAAGWCDMLGLGLLTARFTESAVTYQQTAGDLVLCLCVPPKTTSISTLGVWVTAAGVTGSGVNALALFSEAGVLIDQTGDMTAAFSSTGMAEGAMGGSHAVTAGTAYYLGFLTHFSGTSPHFAATGTTQTANFPVINGHRPAIFKSSQASVPASFTPSSYTPNSGYFIMYGR